MMRIRERGTFEKTTKFLINMKTPVDNSILNKYGERGVNALSAATPVKTGKTASSWSFTIVRTKNGAAIEFHNSNIQNGVPIATILQYGHSTKNGHWVQGVDYINPALKPIFDGISQELWKEVNNS